MRNTEKSKGEALIRTSEGRKLATRSAALAKRGLESLQDHYRIIRFPFDKSIGNAYLFDRNYDVVDWDEYLHSRQMNLFSRVEEIKEVRGELRVPYGQNLVLVIKDSSMFSFLSILAANDLQGVCLETDLY